MNKSNREGENDFKEINLMTEKLQGEKIKEVVENPIESVTNENIIIESNTNATLGENIVDGKLQNPEKTIEEANIPNNTTDNLPEAKTEEKSICETKIEVTGNLTKDEAVEEKNIHEIKISSDNVKETVKEEIAKPENKEDQSRHGLDFFSRLSKSKSPAEIQQANETIENFKRNLQFIASHPKFSNLHAQTMKLLSTELSKNVDSEILKAKLNKKELGYLVRKLEEKELGYLFFDGMDEKCLGK